MTALALAKAARIARDVPPELREQTHEQMCAIAQTPPETEIERLIVASALMIEVALGAILEGRDPHEALLARVRARTRPRRHLARRIRRRFR